MHKVFHRKRKKLRCDAITAVYERDGPSSRRELDTDQDKLLLDEYPRQ